MGKYEGYIGDIYYMLGSVGNIFWGDLKIQLNGS